MKIVTRLFSILAVAALSTLYMSCKSDDPTETVEEKQFKQVVAAWTLTEAKLDNTLRTSEFTGFTLTTSGTFAEDGTYNYSTSGTKPNPSPWPASGNWKFGTDPTSDIIRDPASDHEVDMNYEVTGTTLRLTFNIPDGWTGGRAKSVTGDWEFTFTKN